MATLTAWFEYREVGAGDWLTTSEKTIDNVSDEFVAFGIEAIMLDPATQYEYKSFVKDEEEQVYESGITTFYSTVEMDVTAHFKWREVGAFDWEESDTFSLQINDEFKHLDFVATELSAVTDYEYYLVVEDEYGATYTADEVTFASSAELEMTGYFEYRIAGTSDWQQTTVENLGTVSTDFTAFNAAVSLNPGTLYELRAVTEDAQGIRYTSDVITLTTDSGGFILTATPYWHINSCHLEWVAVE